MFTSLILFCFALQQLWKLPHAYRLMSELQAKCL